MRANASLPRYEIRLVACHRLPSRSFFFRGRQFPVCARCTGIVLGYLSYPAFFFGLVQLDLWIALALNIPALVDGVTQAAGWRESNNILRVVSGFLSGFSQVAILAAAGTVVGRILLALIHGGFGVLS
jgi:uncharacterized membrane protein